MPFGVFLLTTTSKHGGSFNCRLRVLAVCAPASAKDGALHHDFDPDLDPDIDHDHDHDPDLDHDHDHDPDLDLDLDPDHDPDLDLDPDNDLYLFFFIAYILRSFQDGETLDHANLHIQVIGERLCILP
jgi:hypothetical protein